MKPPDSVAHDLCRSNFEAFATRAFRVIEPATPFEYNWHIGCLSEHLTAVYRGELKRLIINIPPRTLKSSIVSIMFPAWALGKNPASRFVGTSFKFERAVSMSFKCRNILEDQWYHDLFAGSETQFSYDRTRSVLCFGNIGGDRRRWGLRFL